MTEAEIETIGKLADMCRSKGVRSIDVGGCKLELEPLPAKAEPSAPSSDPDMCKCGHPEFAHNNGLCIHACEPEKCVENPEAT